jgi:hypothetical protein
LSRILSRRALIAAKGGVGPDGAGRLLEQGGSRYAAAEDRPPRPAVLLPGHVGVPVEVAAGQQDAERVRGERRIGAVDQRLAVAFGFAGAGISGGRRVRSTDPAGRAPVDTFLLPSGHGASSITACTRAHNRNTPYCKHEKNIRPSLQPNARSAARAPGSIARSRSEPARSGASPVRLRPDFEVASTVDTQEHLDPAPWHGPRRGGRR